MEKDCEFSKIIRELEKLSRNKEVQIMMLAEKYAAMDIASMRAEERAEGRNSALYELVEDGSLTISKAAKKAGMDEEQFKNNMLLTGHKVP